MTSPITDAMVEAALKAFYPTNGNRPWPRVARDLMEAALEAALPSAAPVESEVDVNKIEQGLKDAIAGNVTRSTTCSVPIDLSELRTEAQAAISNGLRIGYYALEAAIEIDRLRALSASEPARAPSEADVRGFADELRKWWSFSDRQQHTHSWHDRENFIKKKLPKFCLAATAAAEAKGFAAGTDEAIKAGMNLLDTDTIHSSQVDLWRSAIHDYLRAIRALRPPAPPLSASESAGAPSED